MIVTCPRCGSSGEPKDYDQDGPSPIEYRHTTERIKDTYWCRTCYGSNSNVSPVFQWWPPKKKNITSISRFNNLIE